MTYTQVHGHADIRTGLGPCSHQTECGVVSGPANAQNDWMRCLSSSRHYTHQKIARFLEMFAHGFINGHFGDNKHETVLFTDSIYRGRRSPNNALHRNSRYALRLGLVEILSWFPFRSTTAATGCG